MRKRLWVGAALLSSLGIGAALSDVIVPASPVIVTLTGDAANELIARNYRTYSGPANLSCRYDEAKREGVCVLQLPGEPTG